MARARISRLGAVALVAAVCWAGAARAQSDKDDAAPLFPGGAAAYVVEVQGRTTWSLRADRALPPASLTKMMTALVVLESGKPLDAAVTVSRNAQRETGTRLRLRAGEQMRARDLMAAMLLVSANDACLALAEYVAGDSSRFVAAMNRRARELGLRRTTFTNPCGHDHPQHLASARDLVELARFVMREPILREFVRLPELEVATLGGRTFTLANTNELIGRYPGAIGVKGGYTPRAGKCLAALVQRDGVTALLVVLNAPNRWWDSVATLDRALAGSRPTAERSN